MISSACGNPGLHNDPCEHALSSYCIVVDLTALSWRPYGEPTALLLESPSHGVSFEHAQSVCHCLTFYAIPQHLLTMLLRCCRDACARTFASRRSAFFLDAVGMLLWCDRGLNSWTKQLQILQVHRSHDVEGTGQCFV